MAYDEKLASRIRTLLGRSGEFDERKMFGGIAFMVDGHMCCGIVDKTLMLRVGTEAYKEALRRPHTRMMDFTGRPLKGFIYVDPPGLKTAAAAGLLVESRVDLHPGPQRDSPPPPGPQGRSHAKAAQVPENRASEEKPHQRRVMN